MLSYKNILEKLAAPENYKSSSGDFKDWRDNWYVKIEVNGGITARVHDNYSRGGSTLYHGKDWETIYDKITADRNTSLKHAVYLNLELQAAERSLKNGTSYRQDDFVDQMFPDEIPSHLSRFAS